jgi:hypothetical protein
MPTPATPSNSRPTGDDRNLVPVDATTAVTFEDKLNLFWGKYRGAVFGAIVVVFVVILGKAGWDYLARQREADVGKAYAAATTNDQLKAFAAANSGHTLAGIAQLRMADDAFAAGKGADALAGYEKAIATLKDGPLVARAQLGRTLAKLQTGKAAEATTELQKFADDTNQYKGLRAEAVYHLATLAMEAGNGADVQKYSEQLMKIDPQSPWTQRAMGIRASMPVTAPTPAPTATAPAGKKDEPSSMQVKLPGK